jgi:hypothetical protein
LVDTFEVIISKQSSVDGPGYALYHDADGLSLRFNDQSGAATFRSGGRIPADERWHLVAVTVDRDRRDGGRFYLDGVQLGDVFDPTQRMAGLENRANLRLGSAADEVGGLFRGWLDEVELIHTALDADTVARLYQAGSAGKCDPTR